MIRLVRDVFHAAIIDLIRRNVERTQARDAGSCVVLRGFDDDAHNDPLTDSRYGSQVPLLRNLPNLRLLEPRVPSWQAPGKQLLHQAALDNLHLVDDRLGLLDGIVH